MSDVKHCKCGAQIEFIVGPAGKPIPVQKVRTVYMLQRLSEGPRLARMNVDMGVVRYVSHSELCSQAEPE